MPQLDEHVFPVILRQPSITGWNRLESRPRKKEFDRSLRAEIRDPLWMLTRQWQMGEFQGEDAASPVMAYLLTEVTSMNTFAPKHRNAIAPPDEIPLEALAEKEALPKTLWLRLQMGRHFLKLLRKQKAVLISDDFEAVYKNRYPVQLPTNAKELQALQSHKGSAALFAASEGKIVDGALILQDILSGKFNNDINSDGAIPNAEKLLLIRIGQQLKSWYQRLYFQPDDADQCWNDSHLEYGFSLGMKTDNSSDVLVADQYYSGHLEWYSFDHHADPAHELPEKEGEPIPLIKKKEDLISFIPAYIKFSGMPLPRYWQIEDGLIDFGKINVNTTDLAKLMVTEFTLVYSMDWCVVPFNLAVGSLCDIKGLVVTDTFGQKTRIRAAGKGPDDKWQHWNMYGLSRIGTTLGDVADNRLFLCPATAKILESPPCERVNFIRDEMANMVWAVENIIPAPNGDALKGFEAANALRDYLAALNPVTPPEITDTGVRIKYRLGTSVPDNWIPFIPVHVEGSNREIQLQKAAMPGGTGNRGVVLDQPSPYFIYEEEIPRWGALVTRTFQRTRWYNGNTFLWLGRRKETGKGEGTAGLKFDSIITSSQ